MGSFTYVENEVCEVPRFNLGEVQALRHASCTTQKILPFTNQEDGMDICWDSPSVSILTHSTVGWDGMDIIGIPPVCPLLPMVQWDGMEWTLLGSPSVSIASHGTVGWDGMDIAGIPLVCPLLLPWWYSGMGWTFVRQLRIIWDSHCTNGHLLAMLDMTGNFAQSLCLVTFYRI